MISLNRLYSTEVEELKVDNFRELMKNEEDEQQIKKIVDLYNYEKYMAHFLPSNISIEDMKVLMNSKSVGKYFRYLAKKEKLINSHIQEREQRKQRNEEKRSMLSEKFSKVSGVEYDEETGAPIYGLWRNSLFWNIGHVEAANKSSAAKLLAASQFCKPLIIDFQFESEMNNRELKKMIFELTRAIGAHRNLENPFNIWFCNYKIDSETDRHMKVMASHLKTCNYFINFTEKSYLELFPRKELIYLTADASNEMKSFNHDAIYILGGVLDIGCKRKSTLVKAKSEHLKTLKLPLDSYVLLKKSRDLSLMEMLKVLHEQKVSGDWKLSFKHLLPNRVYDESEMEEMNQHKKQDFSFRRKQLHSGTSSLFSERDIRL